MYSLHALVYLQIILNWLWACLPWKGKYSNSVHQEQRKPRPDQDFLLSLCSHFLQSEISFEATILGTWDEKLTPHSFAPHFSEETIWCFCLCRSSFEGRGIKSIQYCNAGHFQWNMKTTPFLNSVIGKCYVLVSTWIHRWFGGSAEGVGFVGGGGGG